MNKARLWKYVRMILTAPIAVPMMILGALLFFVWKPFGAIGLVGMMLMGFELNIE